MTQVIEAVSSMERCPFCGSELRRKYNANPRRLITLDGEYSVLERVSRCSNRECPGYERSFRAEELQAIILPRKIFSLDVIMYIGTLRYEEHKTYEEIKEDLGKKGIKISMGELTNLTVTQIKKFWCGLFYTYDHDGIPRTNNDMERFIWELRKNGKE